jgi:chromatin remodeling complex protein RSC6
MAAKKKKVAKKGAAKKAVKKAPMKKASAKKAAKKVATKKAAKRKPNAAFMAPKQPDEALGAVVGHNALPRTEITKKLWAYIKKQGLQDAKERRMINADDKLKPIFGGKKQVSMFEMTKLVNKHIK